MTYTQTIGGFRLGAGINVGTSNQGFPSGNALDIFPFYATEGGVARDYVDLTDTAFTITTPNADNKVEFPAAGGVSMFGRSGLDMTDIDLTAAHTAITSFRFPWDAAMNGQTLVRPLLRVSDFGVSDGGVAIYAQQSGTAHTSGDNLVIYKQHFVGESTSTDVVSGGNAIGFGDLITVSAGWSPGALQSDNGTLEVIVQGPNGIEAVNLFTVSGEDLWGARTPGQANGSYFAGFAAGTVPLFPATFEAAGVFSSHIPTYRIRDWHRRAQYLAAQRTA